ncbi:MAG: hypothetical protein ACK4WJ_00840 [Endomicrobiia bacterium]
MKKYIFLIFIFFNKILLLANQVEIINLPLARSLSLASETALINNRSFNVLTNPSMLYRIDSGYNLEFNKLFYYADSGYNLLGLSIKEADGNVSFVFGNFSSGKLKVFNIEGNETGEVVEYTVSLLAVGFSSKISSSKNYDLYLGLSGYGIFEKINIESQYWGGNVGLVYERRLNNKIFKSLNIGSVIKGFGMNSNLMHNEAVSLEMNRIKFIFGYQNYYPKKTEDNYKAGVSCIIYQSKNKNYNIILDLGYNFGFYNESFSCGFEIKIKNILINYSFANHSYLSGLHNLFLSFKL